MNNSLLNALDTILNKSDEVKRNQEIFDSMPEGQAEVIAQIITEVSRLMSNMYDISMILVAILAEYEADDAHPNIKNVRIGSSKDTRAMIALTLNRISDEYGLVNSIFHAVDKLDAKLH